MHGNETDNENKVDDVTSNDVKDSITSYHVTLRGLMTSLRMTSRCSNVICDNVMVQQ